MENRPTTPGSSATSHVEAENLSAAADGRLAQLSSLMQDWEATELRAPNIIDSEAVADQLAEARLGVASSLFTALRWKHEPTAQHCLRVALSCSGWAELIGLPDAVRDDLELSALLHDVGKIGVLDAILCKPGMLTAQEASIMECHWLMGEQILRSTCANETILETIKYTRAWFDGARGNFDKRGDQLPLGSRMLSIVDAFDAMTSDHVYRRALSVQRAFDELYRCAGTQFDPDLVTVFNTLYEKDPLAMLERASQRWLANINPEWANGHWRRGEAAPTTCQVASADSLFQQKLVDSMQDGAIFIDASKKVVGWNHGAERLTGISGKSMRQHLFVPSLLQLRDEDDRPIPDGDCPVSQSLRNGAQWMRRLHVANRDGRTIAVDAHASPVVDAAGTVVGLTLLLHDVSSEISLEERCQSLHDKATKDALTGAANRAEMDRVLAEFVAAHRETKRPCSLIMTDIDRFKSINDTYGHQAGDQVIQSIAQMMKSFSRAGDLVARYGGEEFALLCADCDNATAAQRAEEIRIAFSLVRHTSLGDRCVTASFGVTEIQPGDTPETLIRRSDRALFQAKESGRNRVVQLGVGGDAQDEGKPSAAASKKRLAGNTLLKREMTSDSPLERNIEKLKGFVADHHAEIVLTDRNRVQLRLDGEKGGPLFRRGADRSIRLLMDISLHEESFAPENNPRAVFKRTRIGISVAPVKSRERRTIDALERARQLVVSLRSYLMAQDIGGVEAVTEAGGSFFSGFMGLFGATGGEAEIET